MASSPRRSISSRVSAASASARLTVSLPFTREKSLTRFKSLFAIRGVPRLREAISRHAPRRS